jgi:hypothetical protein
MNTLSLSRGLFRGALTVLAVRFFVGLLHAGVTEVHIAVTPKCPHGVAACYPAAAQALQQLVGIETVASHPDTYNCMAQVWLKDAKLPDVKKWEQEFKSLVGESYIFRGVELTIEGTVEVKEGKLFLQSEAFPKALALGPLEHKLQWNYLKSAARGPEDVERSAFQQLQAEGKRSAGGVKVRVTGPFRTSPNAILEVREFFTLASYDYPNEAKSTK